MSVRIKIDIPDDVHVELKRRAAAEHTSIRSLIANAIEARFRPRQSRTATGPVVRNEELEDRALWETSITDGWSIWP